MIQSEELLARKLNKATSPADKSKIASDNALHGTVFDPEFLVHL